MNYIEKNKEYWNSLADAHQESSFYKDNKSKYDDILPNLDYELLGDIKGKNLLHLQCHYGQDTLSLSEKGAVATGIDFSDTAIKHAKAHAVNRGLNTQFITSNVLHSRESLIKESNSKNVVIPPRCKYDIIYTSYGTIGWLPDLKPWALQISSLLKKGGRFIIIDFHPFVWTLNDDNYTHFAHSYFNKQQIVEKISTSYTGNQLDQEYEIHSWNHPISDIIQPLLNCKLTLKNFRELDYSPYPCFPGLDEVEPRKYKFKHLSIDIPMIYAMEFIK